jgi:hypothetical protein
VEAVVHLAGSTAPIANATVNLRTASGNYRSAVSGADGAVSFAGLPFGEYTVSTPIVNLRAAVAGSVPDSSVLPRELSLKIAVDPDRPDWRVSLGLLRPATISGTIRDSSGAPVPDALVSAMGMEFRAGRRTLVTESSTRSDAAGAYTLTTCAWTLARNGMP